MAEEEYKELPTWSRDNMGCITLTFPDSKTFFIQSQDDVEAFFEAEGILDDQDWGCGTFEDNSDYHSLAE